MASGRKFQRNLKRIDKRLETYLANPENEKNIHDIRTSVRRLDATFSLLPKKIRKQHRGRIEKYRAFLKASSQARDCDIIVGRVAALAGLDTSDLQKKKNAQLARATMLARSLKKLPPMKITAQNDRRMEKVANRLIEKMGRALPQVLSDASRVEELHGLRKGFRKLRYILEVVPAGDKKRYMKKAGKAAGREIDLKELQTFLGLIHDSDITIEYLHGRQDAKQALDKELAARQQLYKRFVRHTKK
jgi:CHAD domain-containing protein